MANNQYDMFIQIYQGIRTAKTKGCKEVLLRIMKDRELWRTMITHVMKEYSREREREKMKDLIVKNAHFSILFTKKKNLLYNMEKIIYNYCGYLALILVKDILFENPPPPKKNKQQ